MYDIAELEHVGLVLPTEIIQAYQQDEVGWLMVMHTPRDPFSNDRYGSHPAPLSVVDHWDENGEPVWDYVLWPALAMVTPTSDKDYVWRCGKEWDVFPYWEVAVETPYTIHFGLEPEPEETRPIRVWGGWPLDNAQAQRLRDCLQQTFEYSPWDSMEMYNSVCQDNGTDIFVERARANKDPHYVHGVWQTTNYDTGEVETREMADDYSNLSEEEVLEAKGTLEEMERHLGGLMDVGDGGFYATQSMFKPHLDDDLAVIWERLQGMRNRSIAALVQELGYEGPQLNREEEMSEWF